MSADAVDRAVEKARAVETDRTAGTPARAGVPAPSKGWDALATPDIDLRDVAGPELAGPELAGPELAGPDLAGPELAGPELAGPELAGPELAGPELAGPVTGVTLTGVTLTGEGPGRDLVAHLDPVLEALADATADPPSGAALPSAVAERLLRLFDAQAGSRWLDVAAHRLRAAGLGQTPVAAAGHEAHAAVALAVTDHDPALLHDRCSAFRLARSAQARRTGPLTSGVGRGLLDLALSLLDGVHRERAVIPHPATVAGHLPRAVGIAWALGRQQRLPARLRTPLAWPDDALVVASFGHADANHSTAAGALNAACFTAHQGIPLPLLLVCEDDGRFARPPGWVADQFAARAGLVYRFDDGADPLASLEIAAAAAAHAREHRVPVLLHLRCPRIDGPPTDARDDPLARSLRALVGHRVLAAEDARARWASIRDEVAACVEEALRGSAPQTAVDTRAAEDTHTGEDTRAAEDVTRLAAPRRPRVVAVRAALAAPAAERARVFGATPPEAEGDLTLAQSINRALLDAGARAPGLLVLGDGVGRAGGPHGVTRSLRRRLGASRVIDAVLDEQTILGLALGAGVSGLLPVPEIRSLGGLRGAADQLGGQAASLQFLSQGVHRNPLVVRVPVPTHRPPGGTGQVDHAIGGLRDVPGLVLACPAHPSDAPAMLRTCLAAAEADGTVSVVLEPAALYHERDLYAVGDGGWLAPYPAPERWEAADVPIGCPRVWGDGSDLTVVSFGHGLWMALRVARRLQADGCGVRVMDLRWLAPLPVQDVVREATATGRCLIVDEARRSGGVSEALVTGLLEGGYRGLLARLTAEDTFVPTGAAAGLVLVGEDDIEDAARQLMTVRS